MYLKVINGTPQKYTINQLRFDNPNTSFPKVPPNELLASWGVYEYTVEEKPYFDGITQKLEEVFKQNDQGDWVLSWNIVELSTEEIAQNKAEKQKAVEAARLRGYQTVSDPLFFKWQLGQATEQEWIAARDLVKGLYPDVD